MSIQEEVEALHDAWEKFLKNDWKHLCKKVNRITWIVGGFCTVNAILMVIIQILLIYLLNKK